MATYHFYDHKPDWRSDMRIARFLGFDALRIDASWNLMEPENGRFDFWLFDRFVETAETSGMKLYVIVSTHLYPDWVEPYLQGGFGRFLEEAEEFAETVVKHVTERYPQVIFAWQVENEPWEGRACG
jgi:GH35 family endo-1,4-beta-xylanase